MQGGVLALAFCNIQGMEPIARKTVSSREWLVWIGVGLFLPWLARIPGLFLFGWEWWAAYWQAPYWHAFLFILGWNLLFLLPTTWASWTLRHSLWRWWPRFAGYATVLYFHSRLDLASDAQAGIGLVAIPFFSAVAALVAWGFAWVMWQRQENAK